MKTGKDIVPDTNAEAPRRPWTAPSTRRLTTSAAEAGADGGFDGVEVPS